MNIKVLTIEDFNKVQTFSTEKKYSFHTYTPRGETPYLVILDSLSNYYSEQELRGATDALDIKVVVQRVVKLGNGKWLMQLSRESDIENLYRVKRILTAKVAVRRDRKKRITQCFNCQRFGHISANCGMPFRCVICSVNHSPGKCTVPAKGEQVPMARPTDPATGQIRRTPSYTLRCANWDVEGHVASSHECPKQIVIIAKRAKAQKAQIAQSFPQNSGRALSGMSYAAAANPRPARPAPARKVATNTTPVGSVSVESASARFKPINDHCSRLLGSDFASLLNKMEEFSAGFDNLTDDRDRTVALMGLLMTLRNA